jgi:hypothetical protein
MRNRFGQVIDCFQVFDSPMEAYDIVVDLLTDRTNMAKLGMAEGRAEMAIRFGGEATIEIHLFDSGVEFSICFVLRDTAVYRAGNVIVFAYTLAEGYNGG